ncbi:MAG TPA: hypothetical protein PLV92_01075 [Pirellulaceae bacterium]|nr:hypothetical protein [Pirellulaceae bacterium]
MNRRLSYLAMGALVAAAVVLAPSRSWAVYYPLGPSSDEWGLKYEVAISETSGDKLNVTFTLASEGRLKPIYSFTVVAFGKPASDGGRAYLVKAPIELKATPDGKRAGTVQIPKQHVGIAKIRILTLTVNGKPQTAGAAYYDIPLKKFLNTEAKEPTAAAPSAGPEVASPPPTKIVK